jgi:D-ribose pyranase
MKKNGILNPRLSYILASMGHTNKLVICDAGFPIPRQAECVDLSLVANIPRFMDTLKAVLSELKIEGAIIAEEMLEKSPHMYETVRAALPAVEIQNVTHAQFKQITRRDNDIAFVRTGEITPFANIILISGVTF